MRPTRMSSWPVASSGIGKWLRAGSSTSRQPGASAISARASSGSIGRSHSMVTATACARSTGTRMQVTPTRISRVAEDLARLVDDLGLLVVVAGRRVDLGVVAEQVEGVRMRQHPRREASRRRDRRGSRRPARPSPPRPRPRLPGRSTGSAGGCGCADGSATAG